MCSCDIFHYMEQLAGCPQNCVCRVRNGYSDSEECAQTRIEQMGKFSRMNPELTCPGGILVTELVRRSDLTRRETVKSYIESKIDMVIRRVRSVFSSD